MNLVFFDIECASVHKTVAKICAFGYVVCDEDFNILKKEDILINPQGGFHLTDRKGDKGIVLPYSYNDFKNYPIFPKVYPYIKTLLEDKNNIVLGHSTMNDVKYLNLETKRFKLPSFEFAFSDSQLIYMAMTGDFSRQFGLEHIANALGVEFTPHRAADDAYATMRIVEAMCRSKNCNYNALRGLFGITDGVISSYQIKPPCSDGLRDFIERVNLEKIDRAKKHIEFFDYVASKSIKRKGKYYGKCFTFSHIIEDDLPLAKALVDKIYYNGGRYCHHLTHCDYYVTGKNDTSARTQNALKINRLTVIDIDELEALLNG